MTRSVADSQRFDLVNSEPRHWRIQPEMYKPTIREKAGQLLLTTSRPRGRKNFHLDDKVAKTGSSSMVVDEETWKIDSYRRHRARETFHPRLSNI